MYEVTILGSGGPFPTPERYGSSYVVKVGEKHLMIDCGPATTHKLIKSGIAPRDVDYLFFTHHHYDHDVDYPCFLLTRWAMNIGDENQLQVYGPDLTARLTEGIMGEDGLWAPDIKARMECPLDKYTHVNLRGGTLPRKPPDVVARDIGPGTVHSGDDWEVNAAPADHVQPWLDSLAYRLDSPQGSIVFTGDTQPCQSVVDLARGADTMICCCQDSTKLIGHCNPEAAAQMAQEAGVEKLVLVHIGQRLEQQLPLEFNSKEFKQIYSGTVIMSEELMTIDL